MRNVYAQVAQDAKDGGANIIINKPVDTSETKTLEEIGAKYQDDALAIADALIRNLPSGTRSRLTSILLEESASRDFLRVTK